MVESEVKIPLEKPELATYEQTAREWAKEGLQGQTDPLEGMLAFGRYLDSFKTINAQMQILALQKTLETYVEFYNILKDKVPAETLQPCIDELKAKHKK